MLISGCHQILYTSHWLQLSIYDQCDEVVYIQQETRFKTLLVLILPGKCSDLFLKLIFNCLGFFGGERIEMIEVAMSKGFHLPQILLKYPSSWILLFRGMPRHKLLCDISFCISDDSTQILIMIQQEACSSAVTWWNVSQML